MVELVWSGTFSDVVDKTMKIEETDGASGGQAEADAHIAAAQRASQALQAVLDQHGLGRAVVTLTLTDDDEIRTLNHEYRNVDRPTDVLSFPLFEPAEVQTLSNDTTGSDDERLDVPPLLLGDVVVSLETAMRQAELYGHSYVRELSFLSVHGGLHLLGYDHEEQNEAEEMESLTEDILAGQGLTRG